MEWMRYRVPLYAKVLGWVMIIPILTLFFACSTKKNTGISRFYHNLTTRYNVYYNAEQAYQEEYDRLWSEVSESYTNPIAPDPVRYRISPAKTTGGAFDKVIEKAHKAIAEHSIRTKPARNTGWRRDPKEVAMQRRTEYNSFLYRCWLLLGQAQFYNADASQAVQTFAYVASLYETEPEIRDQARLWQIRALSNLGRSAEATPLIALVDTSDRATRNYPYLYHMAQAERLLGLGDTLRALPHLELSAETADQSVQRARLHFLSGQLWQSLGKMKEAYRNYNKVTGLSLTSGLEFASKLKRIELSSESYPTIIRQLRRMAGLMRYRSQWDQIYYAMGNMYLSHRDSLRAEEAFRLGADSSSFRLQDYAFNQVALGDLYLSRRQYLRAWERYQSALPSLPISYPRRAELQYIASSIGLIQTELTELHRLDSLVRLASLPETKLMKFIDQQIQAYKREKQLEQGQQTTSSQPLLSFNGQNTPTSIPSPVVSPNTGSRSFYFYNPVLIAQGKREFIRIWGNRTLEDNWQRRDRRRLVAPSADSSVRIPTSADSLDQRSSDPVVASLDDPSQPAYYLANLPLSVDQRRQVDSQRSAYLMSLGRLLQDRLDLLPNAVEVYLSVIGEFPQTSAHPEALHQLYLLYARMGKTGESERMRTTYLNTYPNTPLARELADPKYYERLASRDSLAEQAYQEVYLAYQKGNFTQLRNRAKELLPLVANSPLETKTELLLALTDAEEGNIESFAKKIRKLSTTVLDSAVTQYALELLTQIDQGRKPVPRQAYIPIWQQELSRNLDSPSPLTINYQIPEPQESFQVLVVGANTAIQPNNLLFLLTAWGYANFTQNPPILTAVSLSGYTSVLVSGLSGQTLLDKLKAKDGIKAYTDIPLHLLPISASNLRLLQQAGTLEQYLDFARKYLPQATIVSSLSPSGATPIDFGLVRPEKPVNRLDETESEPILGQQSERTKEPTLEEMRELDRLEAKRRRAKQTTREQAKREQAKRTKSNINK